MAEEYYIMQTPKKRLDNSYLFKIWVLERILDTNYTKMKDFAVKNREKVEDVINRNYNRVVDEIPEARELIRTVKEVIEWTMA